MHIVEAAVTTLDDMMLVERAACYVEQVVN